MSADTTPTFSLNDQQLLDWLRLIRTDGIGPKTFQSLVNQFGGASEALRALPELSQRKTGRRLEPVSAADCEREITAARRMGARFIARGASGYPRALAVIDSAPPLLAVLGPLALDRLPLVAIVGSRNASLPGLKMAEKLAVGLGREGYGVVSGLARGIDTRAHVASLATGSIAVVAGGLDRLYPEENRGLFEQLCAQGAVVSEMPFGWEPRGRDFPRRNRIVSGLSRGTIVVEANHKSGSLITARFASEQGREVFAVPGSPLDPRAEGPNALIRQGATLVTNADDVHRELKPQILPEPEQMRMLDGGGEQTTPLWDELEWLAADNRAAQVESEPAFGGWHEGEAFPVEWRSPSGSPQTLRARALELLSAAPSEADDLARTLGVSAREVNLLLFDLENDGTIERRHGGSIALRPVP